MTSPRWPHTENDKGRCPINGIWICFQPGQCRREVPFDPSSRLAGSDPVGYAIVAASPNWPWMERFGLNSYLPGRANCLATGNEFAIKGQYFDSFPLCSPRSKATRSDNLSIVNVVRTRLRS